MIDDEVQVREITSRPLQVQRGAGLLIEKSKGQALVDAEIANAQLPGPLPERIRDFLIIHEPGALAQLRSGVHFPGADAKLLDLPFHLLDLALAQVGAEEAVSQHAL